VKGRGMEREKACYKLMRMRKKTRMRMRKQMRRGEKNGGNENVNKK
jgi:hypothetical protein